MVYKLSPSTLNLLNECSRCFWLYHNKGIKRPEGIFPSLPNGMDKIIKSHFDSFIAKDQLPPELSELRDVKLFSDVELLNTWRSNFKGLEWKDSKGNILKGCVDNILQKDNKLIVLDYKTRGYELKENTHEYYADQMSIYNFLLRKNRYETEDYAYLLFYYPNRVGENGQIVFNTKLIKIDALVNNVETMFNNAIKTLGGNMPQSDISCVFCNWISQINKRD